MAQTRRQWKWEAKLNLLGSSKGCSAAENSYECRNWKHDLEARYLLMTQRFPARANSCGME